MFIYTEDHGNDDYFNSALFSPWSFGFRREIPKTPNRLRQENAKKSSNRRFQARYVYNKKCNAGARLIIIHRVARRRKT